MRKTVDITDKLEFAENPVIIINGTELEVNTDAASVLKVMALTTDEDFSNGDVDKAVNMLFTKESAKTLREMNLKMKDYQTVVFEAMNLAVGADEGDEGNV